MSLNHEFYLIKLNHKKPYEKTTFDYLLDDHYEFKKKVDVIDCITIHDDVIAYFIDIIGLIPSVNLSNTYKNQMGICIHGITLFNKTSSKKITNLIRSLIHLAEEFDEDIVLNGGWSITNWNVTNDIQENPKMKIKRVDAIAYLNKILEYSKKICDEDYVIVHFGI